LKDARTRADGAAVATTVLTASYVIALGIVGALILSRLRRNRIGWLLLLSAVSLVGAGALQNILAQSIGGTAAPTTVAYLAAWLSGWSWWLLVGPLLLLLLLFPTGYLLSPRWRWASLPLTLAFPSRKFNFRGPLHS
jgi:hypothetical protein